MNDADPSVPVHSVDIILFGGGIAGLWLLNRLRHEGYSVLLLESSALGNGQSIASQGIIHGGLKYALAGTVSDAAATIAAMPDRWRNCLAGRDSIDLSGCRVLSDDYFMWSDGSYRSRLKSFLGSKMLRGRVDPVAPDDFPPGFAPARGQGSLYRLPDFVIDTASLLNTLAASAKAHIVSTADCRVTLMRNSSTDGTSVRLQKNGFTAVIRAQRLLLAAGEGNAGLMQLAGLDTPLMQTRPLNMVMARGDGLPSLYVHCIGDDFSLTPKLTITSHRCGDNRIAWYLGGELAESGVSRSDTEQITEAKTLLNGLLPWVDLAGVEWACFRINRAEGREAGQHRPDSVFLRAIDDILIAWPTKFTLSPLLGDTAVSELRRQSVRPAPPDASLLSLQDKLGAARVARPPWETCYGNS